MSFIWSIQGSLDCSEVTSTLPTSGCPQALHMYEQGNKELATVWFFLVAILAGFIWTAFIQLPTNIIKWCRGFILHVLCGGSHSIYPLAALLQIPGIRPNL